MDAAKWDVVISQGARFSQQFTLLDEIGQPVDLTDKFIELAIRQGMMVKNEVLYADLTTGYAWNNLPIIHLDVSNAGTFFWEMDSFRTKQFDWFTRAYYDILLTTFTANAEVLWNDGTKSIPNDGTYLPNMSDCLGEDVMTVGSGLDDFYYRGPFTGTGAFGYEVRIYTTGAQDTFEYRYHNGTSWSSWDNNGTAGYNCQPAGIGISSEGITAYFSAITGHTVGDTWQFYCWDYSGWEVTLYDTTYGGGTFHPATAAGGGANTNARAVKPFRHYKDMWFPYNGLNYFAGSYTPGVSYPNDLSLTGHLTCNFSPAYYNDAQFSVCIDTIGTPDTYRWRANAGGSWYNWSLNPTWLKPGELQDDQWSEIVVPCHTTPRHFTAGMYFTWGATTGHGLYDQWYFKVRAPIISVINSSMQNNGLYRMAMITGNGEGIAMRGPVSGYLGTGLGIAHDTTVQLKKVALDTNSCFKPLRGNVEVVPLLAHQERHVSDRWPLFAGY